MPVAPGLDVDVSAYLEWIGFGGTPRIDLATLTELQQTHLTAVPFENLDVALGAGVDVDIATSIDKIIERGRGGWCFELNGAFGALLEAIGFDVRLLGAAVLLGGPSSVVDHLALEVTVDQPYLVDVGFGEGFTRPLALNSGEPQPGGTGDFQLIGSPQGTTLTALDDGVPVPQYRFKRVAHSIDQFAPASQALQVDPSRHWSAKPFATRLLDRGPDRVTLTHDRLKVVRDGRLETQPVLRGDWPAVLSAWFGIALGAAEVDALGHRLDALALSDSDEDPSAPR